MIEITQICHCSFWTVNYKTSLLHSTHWIGSWVFRYHLTLCNVDSSTRDEAYSMNSATLRTLLACTSSSTDVATCRPMSSPAPVSPFSLQPPHSVYTYPHAPQPHSSSGILWSEIPDANDLLDTSNREELLSAVVAVLVIINVVLVGVLLRKSKGYGGDKLKDAPVANENAAQSAERSACRCTDSLPLLPRAAVLLVWQVCNRKWFFCVLVKPEPAKPHKNSLFLCPYICRLHKLEGDPEFYTVVRFVLGLCWPWECTSKVHLGSDIFVGDNYNYLI